ncbi:MAG TPA: DUF1232 domain-containing protein [Dehalococcoidia bacterium]|nr:DUF1232 domain-containing protein [Dehalococcoidia bacterium]
MRYPEPSRGPRYTDGVETWQVIAVSVAAAAIALVAVVWLTRRATRHPVIRRVLALPARGKLTLARRLLSSPDVPLAAKLPLPALFLYLTLPFDLMPDFIPVLGYADDALAVAGVIALVLWLTPRAVIEREIEAEEARFGLRG